MWNVILIVECIEMTPVIIFNASIWLHKHLSCARARVPTKQILLNEDILTMSNRYF